MSVLKPAKQVVSERRILAAASEHEHDLALAADVLLASVYVRLGDRQLVENEVDFHEPP